MKERKKSVWIDEKTDESKDGLRGELWVQVSELALGKTVAVDCGALEARGNVKSFLSPRDPFCNACREFTRNSSGVAVKN